MISYFTHQEYYKLSIISNVIVLVFLGCLVGKKTLPNSSRIFIVMLHLYGTGKDTKIWAKIISAHAKKCSRM